MNKIRAAVIGCGNISVMHLDSIAALDESELVAVCDIKPERANAAAEKYHTKAYTDYQEMFQKEKPDVVHLCLPHYLHTIVARDAFRAGIHVLSEKPMSIQYDDAVETVELADQCSVKYGVIFQCRYNTPYILVKKRITVRRQFGTQSVDPRGIQTSQRNGKSVPHFLLKLLHHTFGRHDQDPLSVSPGDQFTHQDPGFQRFSKTDGISDQDPFPGSLKCLKGRLQLIGKQIHHCPAAHMNVVVHRLFLTPGAFQKKTSGHVLRSLIRNKTGIQGIDSADIFQISQKLRFAVSY